MLSFIRQRIRESISVKRDLLRRPAALRAVAEAARRIAAAFRDGHKLLLAGNGGSAADAQHIAGEMVNRFRFDRPALPAVALSTDTSVLTAIGNDSAFELVFARQVEALGTPGDVLLAISTSGNSANILRALRTARRRGLVTIGLAGGGGGRMRKLCDLCLAVPVRDTPRVQETQILLAHIICGLVEQALFRPPRGRR